MEVDETLTEIDLEAWSFVMDTKIGLSRLIRVLLLSTFTVLSLYEMYKTMEDYFETSPSSSLTLKPKIEMPMPEVYICPTTILQRSVLRENRSLVEDLLTLNGLLDFEHVTIGKRPSKFDRIDLNKE